MMKKCKICQTEFEITGHGRKYCFICSPPVSNNLTRSDAITCMRKAMKKQAVKLHGGKCTLCGYNKCLDALEFHHRNPKEKEFGLASNGNTTSWKNFYEETKKCDLICANCHAEIHAAKDKFIS